MKELSGGTPKRQFGYSKRQTSFGQQVFSQAPSMSA